MEASDCFFREDSSVWFRFLLVIGNTYEKVMHGLGHARVRGCSFHILPAEGVDENRTPDL
jgi:hypothetical protein